MDADQRKVQERIEKAWLDDLFTQAQTRKYFGKLIITMEDGLIRHVFKEEALKPPRSG